MWEERTGELEAPLEALRHLLCELVESVKRRREIELEMSKEEGGSG